MKTATLKKGLGIFIIIFTLTNTSFSQNYPNYNDGNLRISTSLAIGTGTLTRGALNFSEYSLLTDLHFNINNHNFGAFTSYSSEIGNGFIPFFDNLFQNDKFSQISIFYGRSINYKAIQFSLNAGPSLYKYKIRSAYNQPLEKGKHIGVGISALTTLDFYLSSKQSIGLTSFANMNKDKLFGGVFITFRHILK